MARYKLDIQKRQHRERSQPLHRQRLGLLEKHSDYVKRAKDYNSKKDRLQKLRLKASLKNHDEFYFKMINSQTVDGVHYHLNKANSPLDNDLVKLLKTQDFNYVKTCRAIEENKIRRLKESLGSMVTRVKPDESSPNSDISLEVIKLIHQSTSAIDAKNNPDQMGSLESTGDEQPIKSAKKTIFLDSVEEVKNFHADSPSKKTKSTKTKTRPDLGSVERNQSSLVKGKFKEEFSDAEDELTPDPTAHMKKLMTELRSRLNRLRVLQTAERELELKRSLMGKGSKFLKFGSDKKSKPKGLINGRDLSWYDKLDRNEMIEVDLERERLEKLNSGIKTGARVWKWKQERKR